MVEGEGELLRFFVSDDYQEAVSFHRWFAMRGSAAARAAVAFTAAPGWLSNPGKLSLVAAGDDTEIAREMARDGLGSETGDRGVLDFADGGGRLLDLCAGIGTMAAMAARLGFDAISVESSVVPHLIDRVLHDFSVSMAGEAPAAVSPVEGRVSSWQGYAAEIEAFADAVWHGAKERLNGLFEEDVDIRLWVRVAGCPFCGSQVPLLSNVRLSRDTMLNIKPELGFGNESELPRFSLLRTDFPDHKGTYAKGFCTCPVCHGRFRFHGDDLIALRSVPVAVRMRDNNILSEIEAPDAYVRQVSLASYESLAASSRNLGDRAVLAAGQPIFHGARGDTISVRNALLPRQRAYFAALAESIERESVSLAKRVALSEENRVAIRSAVALLISGQADYVNTYAHWLIDKPHPSTSAGPLRVGGLFAEVGGYWLERFWRNRLHHLLNLLRENSSAARPVRAIRADAAEIPLEDSSVSAVVWDPPYYDNVDYDTAGEHYQAVLAAMVPDLVSELVVPHKPPLPERTERYESSLLRQACEARRVVRSNGSIGVFWLAKQPAELQHFLELIAPAGLQLLGAVRLDTIRSPRGVTGGGPQTYLLVLQPVPVAASAVVVDADKVLELAADGALSLYDGLAELLESAWDPEDLVKMIPVEFHGSMRQRLAGFLASHPEPELLLMELGRPTLQRELVNRGADRDSLVSIDARALARRLLAQLGFAVARPARFSIRAALRECEIVNRQLELADSVEAVRGAFLTGCTLVERILRYASFAWSYLACGSRWDEALSLIIKAGTPGHSYAGPDKLTFGQYELLFEKLPATFADSANSSDGEFFSKISKALRKARINSKLSALVAQRNSVGHDKLDNAPLSLAQLRRKCCTVLTEAHAALADVDNQRFLPLTVRPEEERRDRYGRRILRLLESDDAAIEVYVRNETDLTEPLIYFASQGSRRDVDPKFLRAAVVEELLGLAESDSRQG